uniref:ornithine decarboxylase n=1 Tax=Romanomermis culicivorax TaxID=13658 RepID=A0A915L2P4_ROMCU
MDVQNCYESFRRSSSTMTFSASKCASLTDDEKFEHRRLFNLEGNVIYPLPGDTSPLDFARFLVKDPTFCNQEEPFYVMDLSRVLTQHQIWMQHLPRIQPYYAVKCNDHKPLIRILSTLGLNFDCASKGEIEAVLDLGIDASRIIYANPCKTAGYIRHAKSRHVRSMTFDNEHELYKIHNLYPEAELILRIAVSDPTAVCPLNLKFGCEPVEAAPALLKLASVIGANVVGVRKSCYKTCLAFETIADVINRALDEHFPADSSVKVIAEPGRFYAAACFTLCCTVVAKTKVSADRITKQDIDRDQTGFMYYINDGVYGSFNCILYDHVTPIAMPLIITGKEEERLYETAVWGPTCDSLDLVQPRIQFPEMFEGDWMVFENMGAYTCAAGSEFNGFPRPTFCYVMAECDSAIIGALLNAENAVIGNNDPSLMAASEAAIVEQKCGDFSPFEQKSMDVEESMTSSSSDLASGAESDSSSVISTFDSDSLIVTLARI